MAQRSIPQGQVPIARYSLRSGPISCPAGQETTLKETISLPAGCFCYIVSRAYYVDGAPTTVRFHSYAGGTLISDDPEQGRNTALGEIGHPEPEEPAIFVSGGKQVKITFYNGDGVSYNVECDGVIEVYRERLKGA